jgi:hypothetical protein
VGEVVTFLDSKFMTVLGLCALTIALGCASSGAKILNESESGGTIVYSYFEEQDVLSSSNRRDALRLLEAKCPGGYRISREGQIPRISKAVDETWKGAISGNGQVSYEKQWAIQFGCK